MKRLYLLSLIIACVSLLGVKCHDEPPEPTEPETGKIIFRFTHYVDGLPLVKDSMMYVNEAGNQYEVNEIKYFISDVVLHKSDGSDFMIDDWTDIYYVDNDIASTLTWNVYDEIPAGTYDSISFRFGIISAKNHSYMFVNPPEVNMMWPDFLGGGYHYMMLNGKWIDTLLQVENLNTHLGIGRVIIGSDTTFVDNSFHVKLPGSSFSSSKDQSVEIEIIMNIESWYKTPYTYDHNQYGQNIMENEEAMSKIAANGYDVFTVGYIH